MNIAFKAALTGLLVAGAVALAPGSASAEDTGGDGIPTIPLYGHPYASQTSGGEFFVGTIDFERFELDGDEITLTGRLLSKRKTIETVFPVEIRDATCEEVHLLIGPPPVLGLQDPLNLQETHFESQLRMGDFCSIAHALQDGDLQTVVDELNEVEELEAGLLGGDSCPWYVWLECSSAIVACGATCLIGPEVCVPCFVAILGPIGAECGDCVSN
jgi:hypothetical protein